MQRSDMASSGSESPLQRAHQACIACRKQKRKCDKQLPSCSLCTRLARSCEYHEPSTSPSSDDFALLQQRVQQLEARLNSKAGQGGNAGFILNGSSKSLLSESFPAMFFLDSEVYQHSHIQIMRPAVPVPGEVLNYVGSANEIRGFVDIFFSTIHSWFPIVSKKRLAFNLSNSHSEPSADLALLLLCMKLITENPPAGLESTQTSLYWTAKSFFTFVESSALMSIYLVQSGLLLAAYEIGHAIYPAAYLTTGQCARLSHAFGFHDRKDCPQILGPFGSWSEIEELRRVRWGTLLLDRYVNLGCRGRPLATEDPVRNDILPADDDAWDIGEMTASEPLYVSSPTSVRAGPFARTCQATHLIGRLIRHMNDRNVEPSFHFAEAGQLHRTLVALSTVLLQQLELSPEHLTTSLALVYSAMIHLYDPYSCTDSSRGEHTAEETEIQTIAIDGLKSTAEAILQFSRQFQLWMNGSPLIADCLYQAASTFAWLVYETGRSDMKASFDTMVDTLTLLNERWRVGGRYLKIIDVTKDTLYSDSATLATQSH